MTFFLSVNSSFHLNQLFWLWVWSTKIHLWVWKHYFESLKAPKRTRKHKFECRLFYISGWRAIKAPQRLMEMFCKSTEAAQRSTQKHESGCRPSLCDANASSSVLWNMRKRVSVQRERAFPDWSCCFGCCGPRRRNNAGAERGGRRAPTLQRRPHNWDDCEREKAPWNPEPLPRRFHEPQRLSKTQILAAVLKFKTSERQENELWLLNLHQVCVRLHENDFPSVTKGLTLNNLIQKGSSGDVWWNIRQESSISLSVLHPLKGLISRK